MTESQMQDLSVVVEGVTGKVVEQSQYEQWVQDEHKIYVLQGDLECLVHELCHWIVAADEERMWPNLFLDDFEFQTNLVLDVSERYLLGASLDFNQFNEHVRNKECEACFLESLLDVKHRLHSVTSPFTSNFNYFTRFINEIHKVDTLHRWSSLTEDKRRLILAFFTRNTFQISPQLTVR